MLVARELGPLFANFVLIVRGGSAITTELGLMKVGGEVRVLEAQGIEPLPFLVMPRVLAMAVSAFCLTVSVGPTKRGDKLGRHAREFRGPAMAAPCLPRTMSQVRKQGHE